MKLAKIQVNNWRGKDFKFAPGKLNYMFHENGYGKTSLLDAIRYGLTGTLPKDDIRNCSVEIIEESTGLDVYRERGTSTVCKIGGTNGKKVTEKAANASISDIAGVSSEDMQLISSGDIIAQMRPDDFLALLLKFIPEQLTYSGCISYIKGFTTEMDDILSLYLPNTEEFGIQSVDECAGALIETRKFLKSTIQQNKQVIATLKTGESKRTLEEIESELIDLQVTERLTQEAIKKTQEYEILSSKREKQVKQIAEREEWLKVNQVGKPDPSNLAALRKERTEKDALRKKLITDQASVAAMIQNLERSISYLNLQTCVISKKLVCTTDKSGVRSELNEVLAKNKSFMEKAAEDIKMCEARIAEIDKAIEKHYADEKRYNTYQRVVNELNTLRESLITLPEKPVTNKENVTERKKALLNEKEVTTANIHRRKLEKINESNEKELITYNSLIDAFADKGPVKTGIINYYVNEFSKACNSRSDLCPGFRVDFIPDGGVKVYVKTPANNAPVYYMGLSSGEKIISTFLIMDMLAQLTGLRMAFIDNLEQLDRRSLEYLHNILISDEFLDAYDHVFVCGVNNQDIMEVFRNDNAVKL